MLDKILAETKAAQEAYSHFTQEQVRAVGALGHSPARPPLSTQPPRSLVAPSAYSVPLLLRAACASRARPCSLVLT
jgi:hypothetical protein